MRKMFLVSLLALALVVFFSITQSAQANGPNHRGHSSWNGGVYYPSHPGAPMYSYYTGDYGSRVPYYAPPRYSPGPRYAPAPRYYAPTTRYYRPSGGYYGGAHGSVSVGRIHVQW